MRENQRQKNEDKDDRKTENQSIRACSESRKLFVCVCVKQLFIFLSTPAEKRRRLLPKTMKMNRAKKQRETLRQTKEQTGANCY